MDETLVLCAIDLSGRPYLNFKGEFTTDRVGDFDTEMVREFFYAMSYSAGMNLHIKQLDGDNNQDVYKRQLYYRIFSSHLRKRVLSCHMSQSTRLTSLSTVQTRSLTPHTTADI